MLICLMTAKVFMVTINAMRNWKEQRVVEAICPLESLSVPVPRGFGTVLFVLLFIQNNLKGFNNRWK